MSNRFAGEAVQHIGALYDIETELRGKLPGCSLSGTSINPVKKS